MSLKKYYYAKASMFVVECSPETEDAIMFTLVPSLTGAGDKKYNSKGSIKIKMSTEEVAIMKEAINLFRIGGTDKFCVYAKALMRDKYQDNWLTFYHKSTNFVTKIGIGVSTGGILTISVSRKDKSGQTATIWFPLTLPVRHSVELLFGSYIDKVFSTQRHTDYKQPTQTDSQEYSYQEQDIPY